MLLFRDDFGCVLFSGDFIQPCGGREPNAHPLGKNALQVHSLRDDVAHSVRRVKQRSHQELGGGVIGDEDLSVLAVGQTL